MNESRDSGGLVAKIVLTQEDLYGSHVDDLLQRNQNMRGETGHVKNDSKWYYRSWFVLMVTGLLFAFAAWALIEPFFEDSLYVQGPVERMSVGSEVPRQRISDVDGFEMSVANQGWVQVRGEKIYISSVADHFQTTGSEGYFSLDHVEVGHEIGLWVDEDVLAMGDMAIAFFVRTDPDPDPPKKASLPLETLLARSITAGYLLFPLVAGLIGLGIGAVDGIICRAPRRALLGGLVGLLTGFLGGFVSGTLATLAYLPLSNAAQGILWEADGSISGSGLVLQTVSRGLAWALAGLAMGLGQGIVQRSSQLAIFGLIGGLVGGLLGGLLFDPLDFLISGMNNPSANMSRMVGISLIGASVGLAIGLVELMARGAWLRMVEGPLAGKEFLIFRNLMTIGSSPRSDIFLFNDTDVAEQHAILRWIGQRGEIESIHLHNPVSVNGREVTRSKLRARDRIEIGKTVFIFEQRANH
jgi:hypothetical protein